MMLKHKKTITGVCAGIALAAITFFTGTQNFIMESAYAATGATTTDTSNIFSATANMAVIIISFMEFLALLIIYILQALLDPGFLASIVQESALREIWIFSRDLMNIIFAAMLIGAGIFVVITGKSEIIKDKFKPFIIAVILVNFSWFFPRVILDVANILTATVYQLPNAVGNTECTYINRDGDEVNCVYISELKLGTECKSLPDDAGFIPYVGRTICVKFVEIEEMSNSTGMLNGLVIGYGRLTTLPRVLNTDKGPAAGGKEMDRLVDYFFFLIHILLVLALMAMLFLPLLAMLVVFIIRIPVIWFTVAFMPFMFISFVSGGPIFQKFDSMEVFRKFIKAAFLPTVVAIPLVVGFILLNALSVSTCAEVLGADHALCLETGEMIYGINDAWSLLWLLMTFFVIWVGFWSAMKIDDLYSGVTENIKNFGSSVGKTALNLPLSIPIIPTGTGKNASINDVKTKSQRLAGNLERMSYGDAVSNALGQKEPKDRSVADVLNRPGSTMNKALVEIARNTKNKDGTFNKVEFEQSVRNEFSKNPESFKEKLREGGIKGKELDSVNADSIISGIDFSKINDELSKGKSNNNNGV